MSDSKILKFIECYKKLPVHELEVLNEQRETLSEEAVVALDNVLSSKNKQVKNLQVTDNVIKNKSNIGVRGWLLLLVIILMFLSPMQGAGYIYNSIMRTEDAFPNIVNLQKWISHKSAIWNIFIIFSLISIWTGLDLIIGRDPSVIRRAKIALWLIGPIAYIVQSVVVPFIILGEYQKNSELIPGFIATVIATLIWTQYLSKSKRVLATYSQSKFDLNLGK